MTVASVVAAACPCTQGSSLASYKMEATFTEDVLDIDWERLAIIFKRFFVVFSGISPTAWEASEDAT